MGKLRQAHTTLACSLGNFIMGLLLSWPSYTNQLYTAHNTTILSVPMNEVESSLVGSLPSLGALIGSALVGWILNMVGKNKGGIIIAIPVAISWLMINFIKSSTVILIARFLGGISIGAFIVFSPSYISEIAEDSIRGALAAMPSTLYCTGVFVSYTLGWLVSYRHVIWANLLCCFVYMILMMTVTESSIFLLRQRKDKEARLAIAHYTGAAVSSKLVEDEFLRLKRQIMPAVKLKEVDSGGQLRNEEEEKEKLNTEKEQVEENYKKSPFNILCNFFISIATCFYFSQLTLSFQLMMGMSAVEVYAKGIFLSAVPNLSPHLWSATFALVILLGRVSYALFTDRFGRRILLISSSVVVTLCLVTMGALIQRSMLPWLTAVLMVIYCYAFMFGAGNVPYVLLAEVFVAEVQNLALMVLMEFVWIVYFFLVGIFPFMIKFIGVHGSFYCFALFGAANAVLGFFFIPETKGLTNEQIQEALLRKGTKKDRI